MDLEDQGRIMRVVEREDRERLVVILGQPDPDSSQLFAQTVTQGDPTWAGPLAGVPLNLPVYHILDPAIKALVDPAVYEEQIGAMEIALETDEIVDAVHRVRDQGLGGTS